MRFDVLCKGTTLILNEGLCFKRRILLYRLGREWNFYFGASYCICVTQVVNFIDYTFRQGGYVPRNWLKLTWFINAHIIQHFKLQHIV
jgi:hypothetical protein